jgi:hypothetical protein
LPIETSVYVTYKNEIAPTADVLYINPISFFAFSNPFTAPKRVTNIDFGYQQIYEDMATFEMPANFHLADNLENVSFTSADESMVFNKIFIKSEKSIRIKCSIEITKKTYLNTEYAEVQKFYEKCVTELSNVIALKKINKDGF